MDNSVIERIKNELDIVDIVSEFVDLSKKGNNFWGLCPFHEDTSPSMSVSSNKQLFKCFVCGAGGDLIKFNQDIQKISFSESIKQLGQKIGIEVKLNERENTYTPGDQKLISVMEDAMNFFQYSLMTDKGAKALAYSESRSLTSKIREEFLIGYAPNDGLIKWLKNRGHDESDMINASLMNLAGKDFFRDRLIFGIKDHYGKVVGFSARDLTGEAQAKYINSGESKLFNKSQIMYNFFDAHEFIKRKKEVFINEGFMDVIAMNRAGIKNSVAIMGTALTKEHIRFLQKYKVILMLDGDTAGIKATVRTLQLLIANNIKVSVVRNKLEKDPDEILTEFGVEKLIEVTENQIDGLEYIFELHKSKFTNLTPNNINAFITSFKKYLSNQSDITKDFYIGLLSKYFDISRDIIVKEFNSNQSSKFKQDITTPSSKPIKLKTRKVYRNYSYDLIVSLIKKPSLINVFKEYRVNFTDPILTVIGKFLIELNNGKRKEPSEEMKIKVAEIKSKGKPVSNKEELKDIIHRINHDWLKWRIDSINVKLENTKDEEEKNNLLNQKIKLLNKLKG